METTLSPRDIQRRIRTGESVADVAGSTGMDPERVERFAAPVLAEREHIAATALAASARRRGESSGHRTLRDTVAERLMSRGIDPDDVDWNSSRRDDGRWEVTADYAVDDEDRRAEFVYDVQGRFSVSDNDDARWLLGERSAATAADVSLLPGEEPTIDLNDELALVRATREPLPSVVAPADDAEPEVEPGPEPDDAPAAADQPRRNEAAEPTIAVVRRLTAVEVEVGVVTTPAARTDDDESTASPLDTLDDLLGGDGYAEESPRVYAGLSDASAVPVVDEHGFDPAPGADIPVEPVEDDEAEPDERPQTEPEVDDAPAPEPVATPEAPAGRPAPNPGNGATDEQDPLIPGPDAPRKPVKRKRAAVPSWDEIMFGGPKPS